MRWLYEVLTNQNIVLTVLISTVFIRLISVFGDIKSRRSSLRMQAVQPELNRIQKKYKDNPEKLAQEQRKFMKENNVSMFGGCLPMLITMPLFFIFITAFRQWGNEMLVRLILAMEEDSQAGLVMFEKFKFLWINNIWQPDNGMRPVIMAASEFFSRANETLPRLLYFEENPAALQKFLDLGFFIQEGTSFKLAPFTEELAARYNEILAPCVEMYAGRNNGWFALPILAGVSMWLSSTIMSKSQTKNTNAEENPAGNSMKIMNYIFPIMSAFFCLTYNAAFALYWTISSALSIFTTLIINKAFAKEQQELQNAIEMRTKK